MRDLLIVKIKKLMKEEEYKKLRDRILKEREDGVIIIEEFCDILVVPEDIEIKVKGEEDGTV